jgi:tetrahydromethanopterin S-methyltransferase subunit E
MDVPTRTLSGLSETVRYGLEKTYQGHDYFCDKGVANHIYPKACIGAREGMDEASAGARTGRPLSLEKCG